MCTGCVSGRFEPSGWDGITLSGETLYTCAGGKFLTLNLSDKTIQDFTPVGEDSETGSLFGCTGSSTTQLTSYAAPVVAGSLFYASTYAGDVYALDSSTGAQKWAYSTNHQIVGGPVVNETALIFAAGDKLYKLDAQKGISLWDKPFDASGKIWCTPVISDEIIYFATLGHKVYALDIETGKKIWERGFSGAIASTPLIVNDTLYTGTLDNKFYALDITDGGSTRWEFETDNWVWTQALFDEGTIYFGSFGGSVYALNANTGELKSGWIVPFKTESGDRIRARPVIIGEVLLIGSQDDHVYGLNLEDGMQAWRPVRFDDDIMADPCVSGTTVYFLDKDSELHAINGQTGTEIWPQTIELSK
ncbi:MAG: PQQ-binding-like beta-propeller repeat protein [Dehalococcoidia bacterium]